MNLISKLKLLAQLNTTEKEVEEGIKMKNSTKIIAAIVAFILAVVQEPTVQAGLVHLVATHPSVATILGALASLLALLHVPTKPLAVFVVAIALAFGMTAHAQASPAPDPISNLYGAGVSYSANASPSIAGTALYAHLLPVSPDSYCCTYAFTSVDALPSSSRPFTVTTNIGLGIAQKVATLGKVTIFVPTAAGISWSGQNAGWQWNGGAIAAIRIKGQYYVLPSIRFLKSSVSNGTGYQPIFGLLFGWGN